MCYKCYGEQFKQNENYYIKPPDATTGAGWCLSSEWWNMQKKRRQDNKREDKIMDYKYAQALKWLEKHGAYDEHLVEMEKTYEIIKKKPNVLAAADWNPIVGPGLIMVFRCPSCHISPIRLEKWLRMVCPHTKEDEEGLTESGGKRGHWRCVAKYSTGACLYKWEDNKGVGRVLILTDIDDLKCGCKYECCLLGEVSAEVDHILNMLRAAKLLKTAKWQTTKEDLLEAIRQLNDECEKQLITFGECRNIRACNMQDVQEKCTYKPYCEDERLSIKNGGEIFKALYLPPETPVIGPDRLDELLVIMAMYVNWEAVKPKNSGEMKNAWYKINEAMQHR